MGEDEEDGEGEGSPRTAEPRGDNHEGEGAEVHEGSWSRSGRAAERAFRRCARAICHKGQRASAAELSCAEPKCAEAPQGVHPDGGGSHCAGWGALEEARFAVAESRSSRSKGGQRPGATRHVLRVRGGSIRQVGKPRARSTDATGCGEPSAGAGSSPPPCQEAAAADAAGGLSGRWADRLASHASARGSSGHGRGCRSRPTIVILVSILVMLSSESCCRRCGPRHVGAAPGRARGRGRGGRCLCR